MAKWSANENSWERQPKESLKAYEAFYLYLQMGSERSLRKVEAELEKSHALISRWSATWNWKKRSEDYDRELRRQEFNTRKAEIKKMQARQIQTAVLLQKKGVEALKDLDADSLGAKDAKDILRFIIEGAKMERELYADAETETRKETTDNGDSTNLASTIISAYKKRMEGEEC